MGLDKYSAEGTPVYTPSLTDFTAPAAEATPIAQDAALDGLEGLIDETPSSPATPETPEVPSTPEAAV